MELYEIYMIVVTLGGGLGNQMFEYAFARQLQMKTGDKKIKLNTFHVVLYENNKEALHNLHLNKSVSVCNRFEKIIYKYAEKIRRRFWVKRNGYTWEDEDLFYKLSKYGLLYYLSVFENMDYCIPKTKIKYIYGVYENPNFWKKYKDIIRTELRVKTSPSEKNLHMLDRIRSVNAVCVHVRRGDYVTNPRWSGLNVCGEKYYVHAMEYMKKQISDCVFFVFSNNHEEIEWIKKNYRFNKFNVEYVDLNNPDYEELRLMYSCKHFIIANSTFSWWAQFLSDSANKIVCAPKYWVAHMECSLDLYEKDWKIIEC